MATGPGPDSPEGQLEDRRGPTTDPRILLFMGPGRNRELLTETLGEPYEVETTTDVETLDREFDCCVFDVAEFTRVAGTVQERRDTGDPASLPFALLAGEDALEETAKRAWDYVDDVIELPVERAALLSRIGNLVERRRTAAELAEREAELRRTLEDLRLKERAMDEAPVGITITEAGGEDYPIVYANEQFERITGYESGIIGEDCRFLQGEGTSDRTRAEIRAAIDAREPVSVDILNYRKDGRSFWNGLQIAPLEGEDGTVENFVGFQTDITRRKIRERRLEVLNRVLSHNMRNTMNVIDGHVGLLRERVENEAAAESIDAVESAVLDLMELSDAARKIERTFVIEGTGEVTVSLNARLRGLVSAFRDRFPEAEFQLSLPEEGDAVVAVPGIVSALEEAVENAVVHNDEEAPTVFLRVRRRSPDWIEVEVEDDGPGIPERELEVLDEGETALNHADRMGLWLIYWVVKNAGGGFSVERAEPRGTVLTVSLPTPD